MITQKNVDELTRQVADLAKQLEATGLEIHHPNLPPQIEQMLSRFNLRASAAKGKIAIAEVDKALAGTTLSTSERMAVKLTLGSAQVMTR